MCELFCMSKAAYFKGCQFIRKCTFAQLQLTSSKHKNACIRMTCTQVMMLFYNC